MAWSVMAVTFRCWGGRGAGPASALLPGPERFEVDQGADRAAGLGLPAGVRDCVGPPAPARVGGEPGSRDRLGLVARTVGLAQELLAEAERLPPDVPHPGAEMGLEAGDDPGLLVLEVVGHAAHELLHEHG